MLKTKISAAGVIISNFSLENLHESLGSVNLFADDIALLAACNKVVYWFTGLLHEVPDVYLVRWGPTVRPRT